MATQLEYQATADSVSKKLQELYEKLDPHEKSIMDGLLGQAEAAATGKINLPQTMERKLKVRPRPVALNVGDSKVNLSAVRIGAW